MPGEGLTYGESRIFSGRRQPWCDDTSRMTRECQIRISERLGVICRLGIRVHLAAYHLIPVYPGHPTPARTLVSVDTGQCTVAVVHESSGQPAWIKGKETPPTRRGVWEVGSLIARAINL